MYVDFVTRTTGEVALYGHNPRTSENTKLASDNLPVRIDWYGQGNLTAPAVDLGADLSDCGTVRGIREGVKDWATKKDAVDKLLEDYLGLSSSAYIHTGMEVTIDWEGDGAMDRTFYIPESELRDAWRAK